MAPPELVVVRVLAQDGPQQDPDSLLDTQVLEAGRELLEDLSGDSHGLDRLSSRDRLRTVELRRRRYR